MNFLEGHSREKGGWKETGKKGDGDKLKSIELKSKHEGRGFGKATRDPIPL